jgi:hypothetical protein
VNGTSVHFIECRFEQRPRLSRPGDRAAGQGVIAMRRLSIVNHASLDGCFVYDLAFAPSNRQLCITLTHPVSRLLDSSKVSMVAK